MKFITSIFLIFLISTTVLKASQTQMLLDKLATASSADVAQTIIIDIQEAWINSHSDLTTLIKKNPNFVEAWNKRATVRFFNGDLSGSETDVFEVLSREPRHFGAISGLALINVHVGALEEAVKAYEMLLNIHPHAEDAKRYLPKLKKQIGQHEL